jgi:hypothetical protein
LLLNESSLKQNVPPGSTFDVSIAMIAPNDPGRYRSEWMFHIAVSSCDVL